MTGFLMSPVPKIAGLRFTKPSLKKEAVKSMVRVGDTVVVEKANGELVSLQYNKTKSFDRAAYACNVWRNLENVLKCVFGLGRISKQELQIHVDAANAYQVVNLIKYDIKAIEDFRKEFDLTDAQYNKLIARAKNGDFVKPEELYRI